MSTILPPSQQPLNSSTAGDANQGAYVANPQRGATAVKNSETGSYGSPALQQDAYGTAMQQGVGARGSVLASLPPVVGTPKPANYQESLLGASSKLGAFPVSNKSTSDAAALAVVQNGGSIRADPDQQGGQTAEAKLKAVNDQADSLTKSAEVSHKTGCHKTFDNHDELVTKLKNIGMSPQQAKTTVRLLEDDAVSPMAKSKISVELASLGVTQAGQQNTAAKADNAGAVFTGLQNLANKEGDKLGKLDVESGATSVLAKTPIGAIVHAVATKNARESIMHGVDGDLSTLAGARTKDDASVTDEQATQTVQDQTLRPALSQAQQAL